MSECNHFIIDGERGSDRVTILDNSPVPISVTVLNLGPDSIYLDGHEDDLQAPSTTRIYHANKITLVSTGRLLSNGAFYLHSLTKSFKDD